MEARCTGDRVRVRQNGTVVDHVNKGDVLTVIDSSNPEWYAVDWKGRRCMVSSQYLQRIEDEDYSASESGVFYGEPEENCAGNTTTTFINEETGDNCVMVGKWRIAID